MPAVSKQQFKFFKGICEGSIPKKKWPKGMTKSIACEFIKGQSPKGLPKRVKKNKRKK